MLSGGWTMRDIYQRQRDAKNNKKQLTQDEIVLPEGYFIMFSFQVYLGPSFEPPIQILPQSLTLNAGSNEGRGAEPP